MRSNTTQLLICRAESLHGKDFVCVCVQHLMPNIFFVAMHWVNWHRHVMWRNCSSTVMFLSGLNHPIYFCAISSKLFSCYFAVIKWLNCNHCVTLSPLTYGRLIFWPVAFQPSSGRQPLDTMCTQLIGIKFIVKFHVGKCSELWQRSRVQQSVSGVGIQYLWHTRRKQTNKNCLVSILDNSVVVHYSIFMQDLCCHSTTKLTFHCCCIDATDCECWHLFYKETGEFVLWVNKIQSLL